jgi:hypothetical protein
VVGGDQQRVLLQAAEPAAGPLAGSGGTQNPVRRAQVHHQLDAAVGEEGFSEGTQCALDLPVLDDEVSKLGRWVGSGELPAPGTGGELDQLERTG